MSSSPSPRRLRAVVRGQVQGVGFRYFVAREASRDGLAGWVRNLSDGRVECLVQGSHEQLGRLLAALRRGPAGASVSDVATVWEPAGDDLRGFQIRS